MRAPGDFVPESSRRARGFATWAALSELGRTGIAEMIERCCPLARRFAEKLTEAGVTVVNDVVLTRSAWSRPCSVPVSAGWARPRGAAAG
ncbi:glutamate/tyrosine decarboxylase-like PLP-dependent enzyme [Amycolatopsis roodepoortensis]|uniref:Glutamate/tyrosine decarboxylase-like PLP-dependent enzyme n=1 Tax=Amycolatopsis roodepoortensis TaxID=700274 RepID=A0ABR9L6V7_9PSEU|nr:glutamate/tyrosine decarboxylase-like PLP-dependent enzyme [Amycolatopsis roodepoortensis]